MMFSSALLAIASLTTIVTAHMFISSPQPISGTAPKDPLDASGSNFPCHCVSLPSSGGTSMSAGSSQLLAFDTGEGYNTAVHGGGSCQMSITYETDATAVKDPKNWYVIYSIEGGCPSNTYQNLDGTYMGPHGSYSGSYDCTDPKTNGVDCVNQFNFTIPKGVKNGHAIMAWTWYNTVGNRELYMNCINTELTGGDSSEMDEFPSMFVANMADIDSCPTTQSVNVEFPFPGKYVTTKTPSGEAAKTASTFPLAKPTGPGCASDGAPVHGAGSPSSTGSSATATANTTNTNRHHPPKVTATGTSTKNGGGNVVTLTTIHTITQGAASSSSGMANSSSAAPSSSSSASSGALASSSGVASSAPPASSSAMASSAVPSSPAQTGTSSGTGSGNCPSGSVPCPHPGSVMCIGNHQFGLCDIDNCAIPQALAAGTHCSGGVIAKRSHVRHSRRHRVRS